MTARCDPQDMREGIGEKFLYLPTNPEYHIKDMLIDSTAAMQSAGKAPYLLMFVVERWNGPDSALKALEMKSDVRSTTHVRPRRRAEA